MTRQDDRTALLEQMLGASGPYLLVVAGPNGAGKTTFVNRHIRPTGLRVVNPDDIARALAPDDPGQAAYEAADVAEGVRRKLVLERASFCMETVFSDPLGAKIEFLRNVQAQGYMTILVFIGLDNPDLSIGRVMQRVEEGGHNVPDTKLLARFPRTLANLRTALLFADYALLLDNSSAEHPYRFIAEIRRGQVVRKGNTRPAWLRGLLPR